MNLHTNLDLTQTERERVTDWMLKLRKTRKKSNEQKTQQKGRCQN